jgi:hypothetical protein
MDELNATLAAEFPDGNRSLPQTCAVLLEQAVLACNAGAHDASALVCRSAVEAACWHYVYITWLGTGWGNRGIPRDRVNEVDRSSLARIGGRLEAEGILTGELRSAFNRVKDAGDSTAHIAEVTMREAERAVREEVAASLHPRETVPMPSDRDPIRPTWIDSGTARTLIVDTAAVLLALFRASARRSRVESPERFRVGSDARPENRPEKGGT